MPSYNFPRVQIDHGRYWRGNLHRWSTQYFISGTTPNAADASSLANAIRGMESAILYRTPSNDGGFMAEKVYGTSGGAPIYENVYGDISQPDLWQAYGGGDWSTITGRVYEPAAEVALLVLIPVAGVSSTGKQVYLRKWYHSVGTSQSTGGATADVPSADVTSIEGSLLLLNNGSLAGGRRVISPNGRLPSANPIVQPFYGNHQMPRGRRRKTASTFSTVIRSIKDNPLAAAESVISDAIGDL